MRSGPSMSGFKNLWRSHRSGELRLLVLSLVIAVTSVSSIHFFADRVERGLGLYTADLLGADLLVVSPDPIAENKVLQAQKMKLRTARTLSFSSVVVAGERSQLVAVKAVSRGYPLRGDLTISHSPSGPPLSALHVPRPGKVWVAPRLFRVLGLKIGGMLQLGQATFEVSAILHTEPDRGNEFFNIAPRLMMRLGDVASTGLVQPGSRVRHKLLTAGAQPAIGRYRAWLAQWLKGNEQIQDFRQARPAFKVAIRQGERYLRLSSLISLLLAGAAIAIAAWRYARQQFDYCAILRCLGATGKVILKLYLTQLFWLGLFASTAGCLLGFGLQFFLAALLQDITGHALPMPGLSPWLAGLGIGMLTLFVFALPPILRLKSVPALRVIRRQFGPPPPGLFATGAAGITLLATVMLLITDDFALSWRLLLSAAAAGTVLVAAAWLLVKLAALGRYCKPGAWRYGIIALSKRPVTTAVQVAGIGIGLMALLIVSLVQHDMLAQWQAKLPDKAPNQFVINIQDHQKKTLNGFLRQNGYPRLKFYPMVRARLIRINGRKTGPENYTNARAKHLITREFNLSWAHTPQYRNRVVSGRWWSQPANDPAQVSFELSIAKRLGIRLGDQLTFLVAGREVQAKVTSLRRIAWDTMRPNFFAVTPPGLLEPYPRTWIYSFYLPPGNPDFITRLVKRFPNLTIIDVSAIIRQIKKITRNVSWTIEFIFVFTLLCGFLVLFATIQSGLYERHRETALLRALGARTGYLLKATLSEFLVMGMLAGVLASAGATLAAWLVSHGILQIEFNLNPAWWLVGSLGGAAGVGLAGMAVTVRMIRK